MACLDRSWSDIPHVVNAVPYAFIPLGVIHIAITHINGIYIIPEILLILADRLFLRLLLRFSRVFLDGLLVHLIALRFEVLFLFGALLLLRRCWTGLQLDLLGINARRRRAGKGDIALRID